MNEYDLINECNDLCNKLSVAGKQLQKYGLAKAEKERDYKICLNQTSLKLREEGMAVTLIDKVVYGEQPVADKRYERDVAETMNQVALEAINILKLKIRILDAQISREWGNAKNA